MSLYYRIVTLAYFVVLNACDILTTHIALANGAREGNLFAAHILDTWGEPWLYVIKLSAVTAVAILGMWRGLWRTLWVVNALLLLIVVNNLTHV